MGNLIKRLNDLRLDELLETDKDWMVVAFVQHGSIACDHFMPEFRKYAERNSIRCCTIEVTENPQITGDFDVNGAPTIFVFYEGLERARYSGPYSSEALEERIAAVIGRKR